MSNIDAFKQFNNNINQSIFSNPAFQQAEASGRTRRSLLDGGNVTITNTRFVKRVVGYYEAIDKGRRPNRVDSGGLTDGIYDWLGYRKYGFNYKNNKERLGIAIAIARKIAKEGSAKFRGAVAKTNIFEDAIKDNVPKLLKELTTDRLIEIRGAISETYKK